MSENLVTMPAVALRGLVVFPRMSLHFDVGRVPSMQAVRHGFASGQDIFLVPQKDISIEDPELSDLEPIGTVAKVKQVMKLSEDTVRVLVEGRERGKILNLSKDKPYFEAQVEVLGARETSAQYEAALTAYMRRTAGLFEKYAMLSGRISSDVLFAITEIEDADHFTDMIAASVVTRMEERERVLEAVDPVDRLRTVIEILEREIELIEIDREIASNVHKRIDRSQKEYFLREQIKAIRHELGEEEDDLTDTQKLRRKIDETPLSDEARETAHRELARMSHMSSSSPDWSVIRTYLETITALPWGKLSEDNMDLSHARKILNEDHYGLEKVKERIIEFLAVRKLKNDMKGPILCLAGPPGVGKTSIAKSVARALDKQFVRMSLGGVRDEAEIRGHRRTYVGAVPGRILTSLRRAGTVNPVFLLDEIDKMSNDFRGDPASAMLEVLDPEINDSFRDHYLDLDFDLSQVLFITTANNVDSIPGPLFDRMEVIELDSYTDVDKLQIAKRHLISKEEKEHGLRPGTVKLSDAVLMEIIHKYTSESGVRELERQIAAIMRKAAAQIVEHDKKAISVSKKNLKDFLGLPKHYEPGRIRKDAVGVVNGLAWTAVGGTTLSIEVSVIPGTGKLELTGQLGDVMKESARTAISVVRSMSDKLRVPADQNERTDLHIHVPEGAVPKDGPSAGVTMVTAIASALTGRPVRHQIAMTGEITLTGRVLKIGGVREKVLAALRAGIHTVILPKDNKNDLEELPESVLKQMEFIFAGTADDVLRHALSERPVAV